MVHESNGTHRACEVVWIDGVAHVRLGTVCGLKQYLATGLKVLHEVPEPPALSFDAVTSTVRFRGRRLPLTRTEFRIVHRIAAAANELVPYAELLQDVWGYVPARGARELVRAHIRNIRAKFRAAGLPEQIIQSRRGEGFRMSPIIGATAAAQTSCSLAVLPEHAP